MIMYTEHLAQDLEQMKHYVVVAVVIIIIIIMHTWKGISLTQPPQ